MLMVTVPAAVAALAVVAALTDLVTVEQLKDLDRPSSDGRDTHTSVGHER